MVPFAVVIWGCAAFFAVTRFPEAVMTLWRKQAGMCLNHLSAKTLLRKILYWNAHGYL